MAANSKILFIILAMQKTYSYACFLMIFLLSQVAWGFPQEPDESNGTRFRFIEEAIREEIKAGNLPGAVVCIGDSKQVHYHKAFGFRSLKPEKAKMELDTVFDLASLTKPIATATSVMLLVEDGKIRLRDPVTRYFPSFGQNEKKSITVLHLLTHTSGLTPDNALSDYQQGREKIFPNIFALKPIAEVGSRFMYSDVGFIVLGEMVHKTSGRPLDQFSRERIFNKLQMTETGFNPPQSLRDRSAITRQREGKWIQGVVHDPRAFEMGEWLDTLDCFPLQVT